MFKSIFSISRAAIIALAGIATVTPAAAQEATVRETHGAWEVRCKDAKCYMIQVANDSDGRPVMSFGVRKLTSPRKDGEATFIAAAEVYTKPGVFLPQGVTFSVDGQKSRKIPFERCFPEGCAALPLVQQSLIDDLKAGAAVKVIVYANPNEPVEAEISLSGFTAAYDSL